MLKTKAQLKVRRPSYYMCVLYFWYSTEVLFKTSLESILGIPKEFLNSMIAYLMLGLLLIQIICFQRYMKRDLIRIAICGAFVVAATVCSHFNNQFLAMVLFVIASKNEKLEDIIHAIYKITLVMLPVIILLSLTGVIENHVLYREVFPRYALGFSHPNMLGARLYVLVACRFYLRFHKLKWRDYLLAAAAAVFCYVVPNSVTATVSLALLLLFTFMYKAAQKMNADRAFLYMLIFVAFACNAISIVLGSIDLSRYPQLALLDASLHGRFSTGYEALQTYGVNLFGHEVHTSTEVQRLGVVFDKYVHWLDNTYYSLLYRYGLIVYLGFSFFFLYNMVLQTRKKNAILVILLCLTAIYGIEESLYVLSVNIFMLSLADVMYAAEFYRTRGGRRKRKTQRRMRYPKPLPLPKSETLEE